MSRVASSLALRRALLARARKVRATSAPTATSVVLLAELRSKSRRSRAAAAGSERARTSTAADKETGAADAGRLARIARKAVFG